MSAVNQIKASVRRSETYSVAGKVVPGLVKLNQNENPYDIPENLKREIFEDFVGQPWNRYPEVFPSELVKAFAELVKYPAEGIIAGNGSNELMYTVLMATVSRGTKVLIPSPTFFLYEKVVRILEGEILSPMMNADLSFPVEEIVRLASQENASVIVLVSPHSPTGQSVAVSDVAYILDQTKALVIVDEAYIDFSDKPSVQFLLPKHDRLIILRTFSKAFSMAGLRIGYLLARPILCAELRKPKIPFSVNRFSALTAVKLIKRRDLIQERITMIKDQRNYLYREIRALPNVEVFPSDSNFLIVRSVHEDQVLFRRLLERNVLVRDVSSYPMLQRAVRVNAGTKDENDSFLNALRQSLS